VTNDDSLSVYYDDDGTTEELGSGECGWFVQVQSKIFAVTNVNQIVAGNAAVQIE
jgi:hypothetical protein